MKSDKLFIPADWKRWIAENLLRGGAADALIEILVSNGFSRELSRLEVEVAANHPYVEAARSFVRKIKKRDWVLNAQRLLGELDGGPVVERREGLAGDEFVREYYARNRPVILVDALQGWPAIGRWNVEYLRAKCGEREVQIQAGRKANPRYEIDSAAHQRTMRFSEYLDWIAAGKVTNDYYMTANNAGATGAVLQDLASDMDGLPEYLDPAQAARQTFFWFGPAGTVTPLHHDLTNNFMAQIVGRKQIKLISPAHLPMIYNDFHCYSAVDLDHVDFAAFPDFRGVTVHEITLHPGDLFFLPVGWWHHVRGLDVTITITCTNFRARNDFSSFYDTYGAI